MRMKNQKPLYFFANWKMYLDYAESVALAQNIASHASAFDGDVISAVFPNALSFTAVREALKNTPVGVGAQNIYWIGKGGCTGEVSADMYAGIGATYALVGHSERRHMFNETNHEVRQKFEAAVAAGLTPVLCVGETGKERDEGKTNEVLETQLRAVFSDLVWPADTKVIVAYEPVWAIDRGGEVTPCDPAKAEEACRLIRGFINALLPGSSSVLLYGGSARPNNVASYVSRADIDGVLVGAASTKIESWLQLIEAGRK